MLAVGGISIQIPQAMTTCQWVQQELQLDWTPCGLLHWFSFSFPNALTVTWPKPPARLGRRRLRKVCGCCFFASGKFANTTRWPVGSFQEVRGRGLIGSKRSGLGSESGSGASPDWECLHLERRGSQCVGSPGRLASRNQAGGCKQRVKYAILWKPRKLVLFFINIFA